MVLSIFYVIVVERLKYLGSVLQKSSEFEADIMYKIKSRWICSHMYTARARHF